MLAAMKLRFGGLRIGEEKKGSEEPMFASPRDDKTWQSPYILAQVVVMTTKTPMGAEVNPFIF